MRPMSDATLAKWCEARRRAWKEQEMVEFLAAEAKVVAAHHARRGRGVTLADGVVVRLDRDGTHTCWIPTATRRGFWRSAAERLNLIHALDDADAARYAATQEVA